jgi:hypothetical protein
VTSRCLVLIAALAAAPASAQDPRAPKPKGDDPWVQTGEGAWADGVDFGKPPGEVEGYNKVRFQVKTRRAEAGLALDLAGQAYYPDGVKLLVEVRHARILEPFHREWLEVKDRAFAGELGPFKPLPGGALAVEVRFLLRRQAPDVLEAMQAGSYFTCSPPCRYDHVSLVRVEHDLGGAKAQAAAERLEKQVLEASLQRALDARAAASRALRALRGGAPSGLQAKAEAALAALEEDLSGALADHTVWAKGRELLLFPQEGADLGTLLRALRVEGQLLAVVAGAALDVRGGPRIDATGRVTPTTRLQASRDAADAQALALRGFLAEEGSLERRWTDHLERVKRKRAASLKRHAKPKPTKGSQ